MDVEKTPAGSIVEKGSGEIPTPEDESTLKGNDTALAVDDIIATVDPDVGAAIEGLRETEVEGGASGVRANVLGTPSDSKKPDPEDVKRYGKKKAKKIAAGKLVVEDGKTYDMSLLKAMYSTVWVEWWFSVLLNCGAGELYHLHR